jgi:hypothetical protein
VIWAAIVLLFLSALLYSWCGGNLHSKTPRDKAVFVVFVLVIAIALWLTGFTLLWIARGLLWAVSGAIVAFLLSVAMPVLRLIFLSALFALFQRHEDDEKNSN